MEHTLSARGAAKVLTGAARVFRVPRAQFPKLRGACRQASAAKGRMGGPPPFTTIF